MTAKNTYLISIALGLSLLCSCQQDETRQGAHRGVYHWKTTYNPTDWELRWMKEHKVDRLYIKLFDVEAGWKEGKPDWKMVPVTTTKFKQKLPKEIDVVPVVYITVDAIRSLDNDEYSYAELIVERIDDMMAEHYDGTIREVQLDCDWTNGTKRDYFYLAKYVKNRLHLRNISLSGTLRLHQLREVELPAKEWDKSDTIPFDRSLLMCYNTGRLQDPKTQNSILDFDDVEPYLRQYHSSTLPRTDVAYPVYGWGVEFNENGWFQRLINSHQMPEALEKNKVQQVKIREEWGNPRAIRKTQRALPILDSLHTVILYHLDSCNLSKYRYEDIEKFYSR